MNIFETYDLVYDKYLKSVESHNNTMIRAVSVTDPVLQECLQEEYIQAEIQMKTNEQLCKSLTSEYLRELGIQYLQEFTNFYQKQFVPSTLIDELNKQEFDIMAISSKLRMRPVTNLSQKRELCLLLNAVERRLHVLDYQGYVADTIGRTTTSPPLVVRCAGFGNDVDLQSIIMYV